MEAKEYMNKKTYDEAIERLESSLTPNDGRKEAIEKLLSLGDYLDAAEKAEYYQKQLDKIREDESERSKKRKAGRALQYFFMGVGLCIAIAVMVVVVLAVTQAF